MSTNLIINYIFNVDRTTGVNQKTIITTTTTSISDYISSIEKSIT